jgi:hypothetical protein
LTLSFNSFYDEVLLLHNIIYYSRTATALNLPICRISPGTGTSRKVWLFQLLIERKQLVIVFKGPEEGEAWLRAGFKKCVIARPDPRGLTFSLWLLKLI